MRKAMTERVVYRQHAERMAEGESHLCQMFTKTNPELLCGNNGEYSCCCAEMMTIWKVQPYACVKG